MKKLFSITFAFIILLAGMHLSIATHYCGGEVAAVKWSLSGKYATCGMENPLQSCPNSDGISSNCCRNEVVVLAINDNFELSAFQIIEIAKNLLQVFEAPVNTVFSLLELPISFNSDIGPPGNMLASAVSLSQICLLRI